MNYYFQSDRIEIKEKCGKKKQNFFQSQLKKRNFEESNLANVNHSKKFFSEFFEKTELIQIIKMGKKLSPDFEFFGTLSPEIYLKKKAEAKAFSIKNTNDFSFKNEKLR